MNMYYGFNEEERSRHYGTLAGSTGQDIYLLSTGLVAVLIRHRLEG